MATTPDLVFPADAVTARLGSMVFVWEEVSGGGTYILEIATDAGFANLVQRIETTLTQMEATFEAGNFYYWRVRLASLVSATVRTFSAPPFSPASVETHVVDGKARILNQYKEA